MQSRAVWDWVILAFVIYTTIEIPFDVAFLRLRQTGASASRFGIPTSLSPIVAMNVFVDLLFIIDIPINFRSAIVNKHTEAVISDPREIAVFYLKSWFIVDFVAAIPFEFVIDPEQEGATTLVGLLKTARLLRLVRVTRKLDRYSEYGLTVVLLLTCLFMLVAHWLACIWHAIGAAEAQSEHGWLALLAHNINKPINQSIPTSGPTLKTRYLTSLYFTLSSLTSVGFGNVAPSTNNERVFSIIVMLMGALMYATIFGNLTVIIQRLYLQTSKQHESLRLIRDFVRFYDIPRALREDLDKHVISDTSAMTMSDINKVSFLNLFSGDFFSCLPSKEASSFNFGNSRPSLPSYFANKLKTIISSTNVVEVCFTIFCRVEALKAYFPLRKFLIPRDYNLSLIHSMFIFAPKVLSLFPDSLQIDICLHIHGKLFEENSAFSAAVLSCKRSLASKLKIQHFLPHQYVIKRGDEMNNVFFVVKGIVHVVLDEKIILALGSGDTIYSEEKSSEVKARAVANVIAQTPTDIHYIEWSDLTAIFKIYPVFREDFLARMVFAYQIGDHKKEEEEIEQFVRSPRRLEPNAETYSKTDIESPNTKKDISNLTLQPSPSSIEMKNVQENLKVIDQRVLHMERKLSAMMTLLNKISEAEGDGGNERK
ncbi:potassium voltage-gated channel subfamily H member 7-like isoform X2 [Stylophora pistillata]|uniref:potassium voltage-gated channel subfamily H member 7-like isoform X2 n=1 Tax=Stylophora pistillata TaxID=50429 RepID=UPI000C044D84|nr:potassium voltage-gated channel subfamily H member 7-like isoform X2 [Stylophora pistillata]